MNLYDKLDKERVIKILGRLIFALLLSLGATALISFFAAGKEILTVLQTINRSYLIAAALMYLAFILVDALRTKLLIKLTQSKVKYSRCLENTLLGLYTSAITPFSAGGQPFQIYHLFKMGATLESASMVVGVKFITSSTSMMLLAFFLLIFKGRKLALAGGSLLIIYTGMVLTTVIYVFLLFLILNKKLAYRIFTSKFMTKLLTVVLRKKREQVLEKSVESVSNYFQLLSKLWKTSKVTLLVNVILTLVEIFLVNSVPCIVSASLGTIKISYLEFFSGIAIMTMVVYFVPTPGSAGGVEGAFYMMFRNVANPALISATILLWRLLTFYAIISIGTVLLSKIIYEFRSTGQSKTINHT